MTDTSYEGWTNRETWAVNLWLANDEGLYNQVREMAQEALSDADNDQDEARYQLTGTLKALLDELEDMAYQTGDFEGCKPSETLVTMMRDIGSLWRVDFHEIAKGWVADEVAEMDA